MINFYITEEDLNSLHKMALKANKNKQYKGGYLDSYNRFKILLKGLINKPVETEEKSSTLCNCKIQNGSCEGISCNKDNNKSFEGTCIIHNVTNEQPKLTKEEIHYIWSKLYDGGSPLPIWKTIMDKLNRLMV